MRNQLGRLSDLRILDYLQLKYETQLRVHWQRSTIGDPLRDPLLFFKTQSAVGDYGHEQICSRNTGHLF
jgi:hypothetical protein